MPLYEYHCNKCGAEFEALVPFAKADDVACESCGSKKVERLASAFCSSVESTGGGAGGSKESAPPPCYSGG